MPPRGLGLLTERADADWNREWRERFELLCRHYELDPTRSDLWPALTVSLMLDHVPGFQEAWPRYVGRPRTKQSLETRTLRADLLKRVEDAKLRNRALSDSGACAEIRKYLKRHEKDHPWCNRALSTLRSSNLPLARKERALNRNSLADLVLGKLDPLSFLLAPSGLAAPGTHQTSATTNYLRETGRLASLPENSPRISQQKNTATK